MNVAYRYSPGQRLAWLADRLIRFERPDLITGSQAAYQYHHWSTPLENLLSIRSTRRMRRCGGQLAGDGCAVFETLPTTAHIRATQKTIILDPTLEPGRYRRRQMIDGLAFVAPEDLCLDLVERARGEVSPAEVAAHRDRQARGAGLVGVIDAGRTTWIGPSPGGIDRGYWCRTGALSLRRRGLSGNSTDWPRGNRSAARITRPCAAVRRWRRIRPWANGGGCVCACRTTSSARWSWIFRRIPDRFLEPAGT